MKTKIQEVEFLHLNLKQLRKLNSLMMKITYTTQKSLKDKLGRSNKKWNKKTKRESSNKKSDKELGKNN